MKPGSCLPRILAALCWLGLCVAVGCAPHPGTIAEFPPVRLGMSRADVLAAMTAGRASLLEDSPRLLRAANRDPRVAEEVFLFYDGRLAAWTQRLEERPTRQAFERARRRYTRAFGAPTETGDDGLVLTARWRDESQSGRVLLSGYIGDRTGQARLMVRVEDPSVVRSLIRQMGRDERRGGGGADSAAR